MSMRATLELFDLFMSVDPFQLVEPDQENQVENLAVKLIDEGVDPNFSKSRQSSSDYSYPTSLICMAVFCNFPRAVEKLLEAGAIADTIDPNQRDPGTPLQIAADLGYAEIAEILLKHGAKTEFPTLNQINPLHFVFSSWFDRPTSNNLEVARLLLKYGADINSQTILGQTPLHEAVYKGNLAGVKFLLAEAADVEILNDDFADPFCLARYLESVPDEIKTILRRDIDQTSLNHELLFLCSTNILFGNKDWGFFIKGAIDRGADVNFQCKKSGNAAIHLAARYDSFFPALKALLGRNPDPELRNHQGKLAIDIANDNSANRNVELLVQYGSSFTPEFLLIKALKNFNWDQVQNLIQSGVNVNSTDEDGNNSLHVSCRKNVKEMSEWLINAGIEVNARNKEGITPLMYATGALDCRIKDPMEIKARGELIKCLILKGADKAIKNNAGRTASDICYVSNTYLRDIIERTDNSGLLGKIIKLFS